MSQTLSITQKTRTGIFKQVHLTVKTFRLWHCLTYAAQPIRYHDKPNQDVFADDTHDHILTPESSRRFPRNIHVSVCSVSDMMLLGSSHVIPGHLVAPLQTHNNNNHRRCCCQRFSCSCSQRMIQPPWTKEEVSMTETFTIVGKTEKIGVSMKTPGHRVTMTQAD